MANLVKLSLIMLLLISGFNFTIMNTCQSFSISLPEVYGNAGCLVKKDGLLLAVRTLKSGKWDIPSGKPEADETADKTAIRETFEETGVNVQPIRLLEDFKNEFYVYECHMAQKTSFDDEDNLKVPLTAAHEIAAVAFIDINMLTPDNTRYPSVLPRIRELFHHLP